MILANSDIISQYPSQLYYSALPFLPRDTYLARQYLTPRGCISVVAGQEISWTPVRFTLPRGAAAFPPGGHLVVVAPWTVPDLPRLQMNMASDGYLITTL